MLLADGDTIEWILESAYEGVVYMFEWIDEQRTSTAYPSEREQYSFLFTGTGFETERS